MNKRHQLILELISKQKKISVNELSDITGVSVVTIRHDLTVLENEHFIKRGHGYAEILDRDNMEERMNIHFSIKQKLAKYTASFIDSGDSVFIEGGSTTALLARELAHFEGNLTVITICTHIASLLKDASFDVILLGGVLQAKSESVVGPLTRQCIELTHFNKAFIGVDGYHPDFGFTGRDMMRADVLNSVLNKGAENIVITDSSKFSQIYPYPLATHKISSIITDGNLSPQNEKDLNNSHIKVYKLP